MTHNRDRDRSRRCDPVDQVQWDACNEQPPTSTAEEESVEVSFEHEYERERTPGEASLPPCQGRERQDGRTGADAVAPPEVEGARGRAVLEHHPEPRNPATAKIGIDHPP